MNEGVFLCVMINSFLIVLSFISVIPVPKKFIPLWNSDSLRYFCVMLPVAGILFSFLWFIFWFMLCRLVMLSCLLRGFMMTVFTLALTGGLHMDGLMDTCDAIFSHRDRETRLRILSDTHAGSFAVIGCVIIIMARTLLSTEILSFQVYNYNPAFIPVYSRLGMSLLLVNLPFAKDSGLAVMLGSSRNKRDNIALVIMLLVLSLFTHKILTVIMILSVIMWGKLCMKIFGGITGDLLGAFVELSESIMLMGTVIMNCI